MKRIILHIGTSKTGTTALQNFLDTNRNILEKQGIGYYESSKWISEMGAGNASFLSHGVIGDVRLPISVGEDAYSRELTSFYTYASKHPVILLSSESLWAAGSANREFWPILKRYFEKSYGKDTDINIIVYLRRQDLFLYSKWKQDLKLFPYAWDFLEWMEKSRNVMQGDYLRQIDCIAEVFGQEHMVVRSYEKDRRSSWDIIHDFLDASGLPQSNDYIYPKEIGNPSISMSAVTAVIAIQRGQIEGVERLDRESWGSVRKAMELFTMMYPENRHIYPLNPEERKQLVDKYDADNKAVARKYLGKESLFADVEADYPVFAENTDKVAKDAKIIAKLASMPMQRISAIQKMIQDI